MDRLSRFSTVDKTCLGGAFLYRLVHFFKVDTGCERAPVSLLSSDWQVHCLPAPAETGAVHPRVSLVAPPLHSSIFQACDKGAGAEKTDLGEQQKAEVGRCLT